MSQHTASAQDHVDAEVVDQGLEVVRSQAHLSIRHEMSPESLQAEIDRQSAMQSIMVDYVRDKMVKEHHYYSFTDGGKPALTKDGAYRICSLFKVIPGPVDVEIIREADGHYTVVSLAKLFNQDGLEIASSRGTASTRESKYAYRWVYGNNVPSDVDVSTLKSRSGTGRNNRPWKQYQMPNPDLADLENTIIKMSEKRATVGAVNKLPLVSELFAADPEDHVPDPQPRQSKPKPQTAKPETTASDDDPRDLEDMRARVEELLSVKVGEAVGDRVEYLKGRDPQVMTLEALTKMHGDLAAM